MRYVEVGGARVSAIGLGTWQYGSAEWGYGRDYADTTAVDITLRALDLGINLIDTAEIYGFGRSERIVGRAIEGRRDEAFIATKVFPVMPLPAVVQQRGRASAARLGVDRIDLYQQHWPNPVVPVSQSMRGMAELQRSGLVTHVGVSNFGLKLWQSAEDALGGPVLSNQVRFSLVDRRPEQELLSWAQQNGRIVIAYSPLGQGLLSARYDADNRPTGGVRAGNALFLPENLERAQPLIDALREIAASHGSTPAQVALAWLIRKPNVVAIPGASRVEQVERNAEAADLDLTDDDDARLTEASDRFNPVSGPAVWPQLLTSRLRR